MFFSISLEELQTYAFYGEIGPSDEQVEFGSVEFVTEDLWSKQSSKYARRFVANVTPAIMMVPDALGPSTSKTENATGKAKGAQSATQDYSSDIEVEEAPTKAAVGAKASKSSSSSTSAKGASTTSTGLFHESTRGKSGTATQANSNVPKLAVANATVVSSSSGGNEVQVMSTYSFKQAIPLAHVGCRIDR